MASCSWQYEEEKILQCSVAFSFVCLPPPPPSIPNHVVLSYPLFSAIVVFVALRMSEVWVTLGPVFPCAKLVARIHPYSAFGQSAEFDSAGDGILFVALSQHK